MRRAKHTTDTLSPGSDSFLDIFASPLDLGPFASLHLKSTLLPPPVLFRTQPLQLDLTWARGPLLWLIFPKDPFVCAKGISLIQSYSIDGIEIINPTPTFQPDILVLVGKLFR